MNRGQTSAPSDVFRTRDGWKGEHTDEILAELGYSGGEIAELRTKGVV